MLFQQWGETLPTEKWSGPTEAVSLAGEAMASPLFVGGGIYISDTGLCRNPEYVSYG